MIIWHKYYHDNACNTVVGFPVIILQISRLDRIVVIHCEILWCSKLVFIHWKPCPAHFWSILQKIIENSSSLLPVYLWNPALPTIFPLPCPLFSSILIAKNRLSKFTSRKGLLPLFFFHSYTLLNRVAGKKLKNLDILPYRPKIGNVYQF